MITVTGTITSIEPVPIVEDVTEYRHIISGAVVFAESHLGEIGDRVEVKVTQGLETRRLLA